MKTYIMSFLVLMQWSLEAGQRVGEADRQTGPRSDNTLPTPSEIFIYNRLPSTTTTITRFTPHSRQ